MASTSLIACLLFILDGLKMDPGRERVSESFLPEDVEGALIDVRGHLLSLLSRKRPTLFPAASHLITNGGKLVRPSILLLSCKALGCDPRKAEPVAEAVEMIHVASLIQDDLMDGDTERRGVTAVHALYGQNEAILASDLLIQLAVFEANKLGRRVVAELARAARLLAQGQDLDLRYRERRLSPKTYLTVARLKTGVLMGCSMAEGAIVAKAPQWVIKGMRQAGELFGIAFQVHDDWLDWSDGETYPSNAVMVLGGEEKAREHEELLLREAEGLLASLPLSPDAPIGKLFKAALVERA